jgi:DNA-binding GntR family transcriptional regulator
MIWSLEAVCKPWTRVTGVPSVSIYGFSFSPVRAALNRLQAEQLVVAAALRGFLVATVSIPQMWDTIETRILIEVEALSRSIDAGRDDLKHKLLRRSMPSASA